MKISRRATCLSASAGLLTRNLPARANPSTCPSSVRIKTGLDSLLSENRGRLTGKKTGLVANPASVDSHLTHIADLLHEMPDVHLAAIFGPEHGFRGSAEAGSSEARTTDSRTGVPVFDIYMLSGPRLDAVLSASGIDLLLFDIQDVGARFYTYIWTLFDIMQSCARLSIPVLVTDRPNPISGLHPFGPVLDPAFSSFVGRAPIALRHAMTIGELAIYFNNHFIHLHKADLTVLPMQGWTRGLFFDQTDLPWVAPSPNMPTPETAIVYPGTCLFEGTVLSVGRGTAQPFLTLGGPEVDATRWIQALRAASLPGVLFRETWFSPSASVDRNMKLHGLNMVLTDRPAFDPVLTGLTMLTTARPLATAPFWRDNGTPFDRLCGTDTVRRHIDTGTSPANIVASWKKELNLFLQRREKVLLYA
ncbi:exo-beta-N-acetylmuramidase NamZ family protein [Acetobacter oeni]|uniref:DUF1343 domain-containing protein n=1 Tax=Acetobacter oeni TaxID=304077 RepID=A0A511XJ70_9PROT|nr:DUF1343 domain-containing protein [Acetobacter oeni]MBB3882821.1 uncharacterized protein YbbC (DUF1343 family) [Acetobacter oeni]NHO18910.1 DUF1343 domain-containing protein [Acetobacter oeni]GBR09639.1 hypothetical protein AA21952_2899 [Acetobacter oeni LMG 21952]GEN62992.1 hypothetical protein AOE01nite_12160 [Acetobacter oeni]